jgi:hypothetical protein
MKDSLNVGPFGVLGFLSRKHSNGARDDRTCKTFEWSQDQLNNQNVQTVPRTIEQPERSNDHSND